MAYGDETPRLTHASRDEPAAVSFLAGGVRWHPALTADALAAVATLAGIDLAAEARADVFGLWGRAVGEAPLLAVLLYSACHRQAEAADVGPGEFRAMIVADEATYRAAATAFIEALAIVVPTRDVRVMLDTVRADNKRRGL